MRTHLLTLVALTSLLPAQAQQPPADPPWQTLQLHASIPWTIDPEVFIDSRNVKRVLTADVDRLAILDTAIARAKAENKLVLWYVPRIVEASSRGRQMYRAPVLDLYMQQVVFNDPDVAQIVTTHFVPIRVVCDEPLAKRFGDRLRPLGFVEPAVVFISPEGEIIHLVERIRTFDALWFARLLGRVLDAAAITPTTSDPESAGQYERALAATARDDVPANIYRRARLLRRLVQPAAAIRELQSLLERAVESPPPGELHTELGLIHTLTGEHALALHALEQASTTPHARRHEARYLLAVNQLRTGDETAARATFAALADSDDSSGDPSFVRRARANITLGQDERPLGATFASFESLRYLPPDAYRGLPRDTTWSGPALDRESLIARGVEYLLAQQRDHGGFTDCRYAYWPDASITPNAWIAITALAATALHAHRELDPERIDAAVANAERFAFDETRLQRGKNEDLYADAYRLLYLAERHADAPAETAAPLIERMNRLLREAQTRQTSDGFFAHEYPNAFCTAAMLWSAHRARQAGATLPIELTSRALQALLSARRDDGGYVYSGAASGDRKFALKDAAARMPLCETTLAAFGQSDDAKVRFAFETFWKYIDRIEAVRRNDFHSDGELAGFFFFHALFHTAEAKSWLDESTRRETDRRLLALLARIPEMDGSFVDSHEIGRSYGTAMALLVLARL